MLNFYLPDFYYFYDLNFYFVRLLLNNPEYFHDNIKITSIYGSFPNAYWNGGRVISGYIDRQRIIDTIHAFNSFDISLRFTFTNTLITNALLEDPYCNMIMIAAHNGQNEVLVNNPMLEEYLRKHYPNYRYISSTTKCLLDIDSVNKECENYDLVVLDYRKNVDTNFIEQISHKDKIELLLNAYCSPECKYRKEHYDYLSKCQITGEQANSFCDTLKLSFYEALSMPTVIKSDQLYLYFVDKGFRHFKIEGRTNHIADVLESYIYYMIKPEYKDQVRCNCLKALWNNWK